MNALDSLDDAIANEVTARGNAVQAVQDELDATQTGAGLGADGGYTANATANYIASSTSLKDADDDLDTALKNEVTARGNADTAINDKIALGYFLYSSSGADTSHTVTHGIGTRYCVVTVIDPSTNEQVIPNSVVFDSTSQLTVTFNTSVNCKVAVMGLGVPA